LRHHHLEHRDLIWSNLLLQETGNATQPFTLMVIDTGAMQWIQPTPVITPSNASSVTMRHLRRSDDAQHRRLFQPGFLPDAKLLACVFWRRLYFGLHGCHNVKSSELLIPEAHDGTLRYALLSIVNKHVDNTVDVDMTEIVSLLLKAVHV
jgi:hypothetical protein